MSVTYGLSSIRKKRINELVSTKGRRKHNLYFAETGKIFDFVYHNSGNSINEIYCTQDWLDSNMSKYDFGNIQLFVITSLELRKISLLKNPHDLLFVMCMKQGENRIGKKNPIIILESIQDPGNLGTIIRTLSWFGINTLLCSKDSVDMYNPKVIQASMGAFTLMNVKYLDIEQFIEDSPDIYFYYTEMDGLSVYDMHLEKDRSCAFVFGNEGKGVSETLKQKIKQSITIPSYSSNSPESLNLSISVGIVIAEHKRKLVH